MNNIIQIKRRLNGSGNLPGAPTSLSGGEIAFNEVDKVLYYGYDGGTVHGDNNPGTIIGIAGPGLFVDRTTNQTVSGVKTFQSTISALGDVEVDGNVDAHTYSIDGTQIIDSSRNADFVDIDASGNLTVQGDFTVYGNSSVIETTVTATSAFTIESSSNTPALTVRQYGPTDVAVFYDGDTANTALIVKDGGNVGINTSAPNKTLTVVGDISATGTLDINSATNLGNTLTVTDAATLNSTLYVNNAASFNSTLSAKGSVEIDSTLTVDDLATFNDVAASMKVEIDGTNVKVIDVGNAADTMYGLDGITAIPTGDYTISNTAKVIITANSGGSDIDLTAEDVNITTGDLEVQVGNLNGSGSNFIHDFIIDGGSF